MQRHFQEAGTSLADPLETLDRLLVQLTALCGFALDDMTQDDGWRMLMLGRRLERTQFLASLIASNLEDGSPVKQPELDWLLDIAGVSITYRTRYVARPQLGPALQLLIFEDGSPRALAYQWRKIGRTLADLAKSIGAIGDQELDEAVVQLRAVGTDGLEDESELGVERRQQMSAALVALAAAAGRVSDRIALRYFSLVAADVHSVAS
jgi:uncharacterized alpha-E superfamily protein